MNDLTMVSQENLIYKWRNAHQAIDDHFLYIRQHLATVTEAKTNPLKYQRKYVTYCRMRLTERLRNYRMVVRIISEIEEEMRKRAIAFDSPALSEIKRGTLTC